MFHDCVQHLHNKETRKEVVPIELSFSLVRLLDVLVVLDHVKEMRTCLWKDLSRYKRVAGPHPPLDIAEDIAVLQLFLAATGTKTGAVLQLLKQEVKRINGHEKILLDTADLAAEAVDSESDFYQVLTPQERFQHLRVIPHLLLLADGSADDPRSFSVFKSHSKTRLAQLQRVLISEGHGVLPLYGEMAVTVEAVLEKSGHFDKETMAPLWVPSSSSTAAAHIDFDLSSPSHWDAARNTYSSFTAQLAALTSRIRIQQEYDKDEVGARVRALFSLDGSGLASTPSDSQTTALAREASEVVVRGLQLLSRWSSEVCLFIACKTTRPCSPQQLVSEHKLNDDQVHADCMDYGRALRYNLTCHEMSVLVDFIFMIKSLAASMLRAQALLAPLIRLYIHNRIQQLVQVDLTPLLHRLDKRNKPILPSLLKLRSLAADWLTGVEPRNDYRDYSRKHQGQGQGQGQCPGRVVGPADTQLFILRAQVCSLCDSGSEVRKKSSVFARADLEKTDGDRLYLTVNCLLEASLLC